MLTAKEDSKTSSKKRLTYNEVNETLYESLQAMQIPDQFPIDLPWPEWSDADINSETWGAEGGKAKSTPSASKIRAKSEMEVTISHYQDPKPGLLPPDLEKHVDSWKRPNEVFPPESLVMYDGSNSDISLKIPSGAVSKCEFFEIISDVLCLLQFHSSMGIIPTESETPHFVSNTKSLPWQPWHHVYGNCKAGKDQPHRPVVHPHGKYILRLYYMGAWRKFIVDDRIPCDADGKSLLPVTRVTGELWPILIAKGILKISSRTQSPRFSDMDLPVWTLFTGWIPVPIYVPNKSSEQIWRWIHSILPHYTPQDDDHDQETARARKEPSIPSKGTTKKTGEKKEAESQLPGDREESPVLIVGELSNFPEDYADLGDACRVAVLMTRDVPLTKAKTRKQTETWKRVRWVRWAAEKGIWADAELLPPYRLLRQINFKDRLKDLIANDEAMESKMFASEDMAVQEEDSEAAQKEKATATGPLQWVDFFKFIAYLSGMLFLFKPSSFLSKCRMTYLAMGPQNRSRVSTTETEPTHHFMTPDIKTCGNEPPILYCESETGIFITLSLWVCPQDPVDSPFYLAADQPDFLKVYHAALIVETHDWRTSSQNEIVAVSRTVGNACTSVFLNPGRHSLNVWLDTDSPFVIDVHSNAELTIGKGSKIRSLMSTETKLVSIYINQVSAAFLELAQKFGKPDFRKSLPVFYARIKPGNTTEPQYESKMYDFIETFLACVLKVLKSLVASDDELRALARVLRVLFISPNIYGPPTKPKWRTSVPVHHSMLSQDSDKSSLTDSPSLDWTQEQTEKAVAVQRMYRGYRVRSLLRDQSPHGKEFKILMDRLKSICDSIFAANKRDAEVARLIREIIAARPDLLTTFSFHRDISNVTVTEEYTGRIVGVDPKTWVPMIRFVFACHSSDPLPCAFYLSCNLERYAVTVTDNDTYEEVFRLVNTTCPRYYPPNGRGYTLFAYGWNESETKTVNWKLEMIKMKYFLEIHPCNPSSMSGTGSSCHPYQPQGLSVQELRNFYVPNKRRKICQCLIKIRRSILLTIRLSMSHESARFHVRIYLRSGDDNSVSTVGSNHAGTVIEAEAKSSVIILPSVLLDHRPRRRNLAKPDNHDRTVYVVEACVLNHTWPLTKREWGVVEPMRVNGESWHESRSTVSINQLRKASSESRRKHLRSSKSLTAAEKTMENPFWYLQVVSDSAPDASTAVEVIEDRSYQEMIKFMKQSWEENDPGRRTRGRATQREFLKMVYDRALESSRMHSSTNLDSKSSEFFELMKSFEESTVPESEESFEALLHEMKSFSYLLQDKTTTRYLVSPRILPWVPLEELLAKYSRGKEETDSHPSPENSKYMLGEDYEAEDAPVQGPQPDRKELMRKISGNRKVLEKHVAQEGQLSRRLMEQAYEERARVVEKMKALREKMDPKSGGK